MLIKQITSLEKIRQFDKLGMRLVAAFDVSPQLIGQSVCGVEILSQDSEYAIVQPMQSDALTVGQSVMLF